MLMFRRLLLLLSPALAGQLFAVPEGFVMRPFAGPPEEIGATRVLQTFVDGRRVHAADDA